MEKEAAGTMKENEGGAACSTRSSPKTATPAWRPSSSTPSPARPVTEVILKIHSRCNLACPYCYVYELEDQGWKDQPGMMADRTLEAVISRCAEYGPGRLRVIFHGGEPLLRGASWIASAAASFRRALPQARLSFGMQTNGTLLTARNLEILRAAGVKIGVSFDGKDARRPYIGGRSSHEKVIQALELLSGPYREAFGGTLTVVDPRTDPVDLYEQVAAWDPPSADFLLPLATHDSPPPAGTGPWLVKLFSHWEKLPDGLDIRLFRVIAERLLGRDRRAGFIGPPPDEISVVFQGDGSAELADALAVAGDGLARTGLNARDHSLAEIAAHPGYTQPPMCGTCSRCRLSSTCSGGFWVTRFKGGSFDFPSAYCDDLMLLIDAVAAAIARRG